jgi:PAS domain S-box-containing protein
MSNTNSPAGPVTSTRVVIGRDGRVTDWPETATALFGWTAAEALGHDLQGLLGATPGQSLDLIRSWVPCRFLGPQRRSDGSMLACAIDFEPVRGEDGGWCGELRIQRVDPAMAAVPEIEARCHALVAAMQEGVVVQALDGRIVYCNPSAERILGITADQMCGRTSIDPRWRTIHANGSPFPGELHPAMVTLRTGQAQAGIVMGVYQPNGVLRWIRINSESIRLAVDQPLHAVVTTFVDITEERLSQAEARSRAEQMTLVLEGANDGFWDWHIPSSRVTFSARWASMLGYAVAELAGDLSTWSRLAHPDDMKKVMPVLEAHLRGETAFYVSEHRMLTKDGRWVWVLDRGKVVERMPDGRPVRAVGTHTDITARREAEDKLRQTLQANEQLVAELREALDRVRTLSGLLPVCARCKSVRNDRGFWQQIEHYLADHTDARFTHGLCPGCSDRTLMQ